jgi:predicted nucleic acid-binding protein
MIRLELWGGVRGGSERKKLEFLESRVDLLDINDGVWKESIRLVTKSRSAGLTVPSADVLIVATALYHNVSIEHCDQHIDHLLKLV